MTENIERIARTVLWAVLSLVFVAIPIGVAKSQFGAEAGLAEMKAELKRAEDKIVELSKPKEPALFPIKDVGIYLSGLAYGASEGGMTFTNTTGNSGFLCLKGVVKNTKAGTTSESIPTCKEIKPYESNVHLDFKFASGDLHKVCPQESDCSFSIANLGHGE